jgi:hypothetical protein
VSYQGPGASINLHGKGRGGGQQSRTYLYVVLAKNLQLIKISLESQQEKRPYLSWL